MKKLSDYISPLFLLIFLSFLSGACNIETASPPSTIPGIQVEVFLEKRKYCVNENIQVVVSLTNSGKTNSLIDGHWTLSPVLMPSQISSGLLLISDASGQRLTVSIKIDRRPIQEDDFVILEPGEVIKKTIALRDVHYGDPNNYYSYHFELGETYMVTAVYQNELRISKLVDNNKIFSWIGFSSGSNTFQIESKNCEK